MTPGTERGSARVSPVTIEQWSLTPSARRPAQGERSQHSVTRVASVRTVRVVGLIASVVVGLALVAAGFLKLSDEPGWRVQSADMGVSAGQARVVPFVELALGAALAAQLWRPWPAMSVIALLVIFTVVVAARLLDGSRPPCACFGARSTRPLGAYHLVRNLGLITLAVAAAVWA